MYIKSAKAILGNDLFNKIKSKTGLEAGLGHTYYEEWRVLIKKDKVKYAERIDEIEILSKEYYSHFR